MENCFKTSENAKDDENAKQQQQYVDDLSLYMAWQNYYWMDYSTNLYKQLMVKDFQLTCMLQAQQQQSAQQNNQPSVQQQNHQQNNNQQPQQQNQNHNQQRIIYKLAPLHKRIAAEIIDFLLLAFFKIIVYLYYFGESSLEQFSFMMLLEEESTAELETMLMHAIVFRMIVVAYEGYMLSGTLPFSQGRSIGKALLGLKLMHSPDLVYHDEVEQTVSLVPKPLGSLRSCFRALLKSTCMSVFFPVVVPVFMMFNFNRLIYDVIVDGVVIDTGYDNRVENNGQRHH